MFGKILLYYTVGSVIIGLVAQVLGANMGIVLFTSLIGPPVIHLALALMRYSGRI